jgi:predicted dienelactone hydrolase
MRRLFHAILLAAALCPGAGQATLPDPSIKVGIAFRRFIPLAPYDWRGDANQALATTIWYPADPAAEAKPRAIGPPGSPLFGGGLVAADAALAPAPERFPLIVISHGTGGTAESLAWLGTALAADGYVVAAANHPGNNAIDGYTVPGFTLGWERAVDLSAVIDAMLADPTFAPRIDPRRIGAAGFSFGGFTVIVLAGGISSMAQIRNFCASPAADDACKSPPEFPDLRARAEAQAQADPAFREAVEDTRSHRDARVRAIFAMAPARGPSFVPESLQAIDIPTALVAGAGDEIVPVDSGARALAALIPHAELTVFPGAVGHYVFAPICLEAGRATLPPRLCNDAPGVDRAAIHAETARLAEAFFDAHLH